MCRCIAHIHIGILLLFPIGEKDHSLRRTGEIVQFFALLHSLTCDRMREYPFSLRVYSGGYLPKADFDNITVIIPHTNILGSQENGYKLNLQGTGWAVPAIHAGRGLPAELSSSMPFFMPVLVPHGQSGIHYTCDCLPQVDSS